MKLPKIVLDKSFDAKATDEKRRFMEVYGSLGEAGVATDPEMQVEQVQVFHKMPIRPQGTHGSYRQIRRLSYLAISTCTTRIQPTT